MNETPFEIKKGGPKKFRNMINELGKRVHQSRALPGHNTSLQEMPDGRIIDTKPESFGSFTGIICNNGVATYALVNGTIGEVIAT